MSNAQVFVRSIKVTKVTDTTGAVAQGFLFASLANLGDADGSITQNGQTFTLPAGGVFNFPDMEGNNMWDTLTIDATGTEIECVYF